ncbi:MAG: YfiR family protein, partial [Pseudomonadota bacterium]|nr:YfiR family protein [Pseudomonadota bacterium]
VIEDLTQSSNCDLLYLSSEELRQFVDENEQATRLPILTVADMTSVPKSNQPIKGVHIMLVRREKRIGFAVNLQEAKDVGIGFSSELLKLSTIVGRES